MFEFSLDECEVAKLALFLKPRFQKHFEYKPLGTTMIGCTPKGRTATQRSAKNCSEKVLGRVLGRGSQKGSEKGSLWVLKIKLGAQKFDPVRFKWGLGEGLLKDKFAFS